MINIDLNSFVLQKGSHESFEEGACAMELAAHLAGEKHSDHPKCVCPVIGAFMRSWNDSLPDDKRNELLKPIIPIILNTRSNLATEKRRSLMAIDWLVRVYTPAWLRLAKLDTHADALENLPEITSLEQIRKVREVIAAARAAAWDATWAARAAAWDATWAARTAAMDAAGAARTAAGAAGAAGVSVEPTVDSLQKSTVDLIHRMIAVREIVVEGL